MLSAVAPPYASTRLRFDQAIIPQNCDPGIPVAAARLLTKRSGKVVRRY